VKTLHTEALVLRSVDFGESDRIVHLLTPATARLTVIAKGARRSVKRFPGILDFFNHLDVQVDQRLPTSMARLEHAKLRRTFHGPREDARRFAIGCYLLELFDRLSPEGAASGDGRRLFDFVLQALRLLDDPAIPPTPLLRVLLELRALASLGLRPELGSCVRCGRAIPPAQKGPVIFHVGEGGPVCRSCDAATEGFPVDTATLRGLEATLAGSLTSDRVHEAVVADGAQEPLADGALREAQMLLARFLRFHVGLELRSEAFVAAQLTPREPEGTLRPPRIPGPSSAPRVPSHVDER
jgi:DNA repair protein RecO (recombination protein O)